MLKSSEISQSDISCTISPEQIFPNETSHKKDCTASLSSNKPKCSESRSIYLKPSETEQNIQNDPSEPNDTEI